MSAPAPAAPIDLFTPDAASAPTPMLPVSPPKDGGDDWNAFSAATPQQQQQPAGQPNFFNAFGSNAAPQGQPQMQMGNPMQMGGGFMGAPQQQQNPQGWGGMAPNMGGAQGFPMGQGMAAPQA